MDELDLRLEEIFGTNIHSEVFGHTQGAAALRFVDKYSDDRCCLVVIGHSFGGDAVIEFTKDYLDPRFVNLTVQIDTVGFNDDVIPHNVGAAYNYFQISAIPPTGETNVHGAININVEDLFPGTNFTHTSIDDDPRLHDLIAKNVAEACPEPSTTISLTIGVIGLFWYRRRRGISDRSAFR
jgi:hypothetical protein